MTARDAVAGVLRAATPATVVTAGVLSLSVAAFFRVPLLPAIGQDLAMTAPELAAITTVFGVGRLATDLPAGRLADRQPAIRGLAVSGVVLAVASLAMALAGNGALVIAAAGLVGVASAMTNTTGMTYFSRNAATAERGKSLARFSAALLGGQALGPAVGGLIGGFAGWRAALVAAAVVGLAVAVVLRRSPPDGVPARSPERGAAATADGGTVALGRAGRVALYTVPFVSMFTLGAMPQTLVPIIGDAAYELTPAAIGAFLGLGGLCRFVGVIVGGRLSDRVSRKAALVPSMVAFGAGVAILAPGAGVASWVAAIVLMSLASYGISVAATILGDVTRGPRTGRRLGSFRFVGDVGLIAGPVVSGLLYDRYGTAPAVLVVAALLVASGVAAAFLVPETRWPGR